MLTVSVVVPVLNAARTLPACLAALDKLAPRPQEIVLVDNGSSDGSQVLMKEFSRGRERYVRVLSEPKRGASAARNTGVAAAVGSVVAFTDADCAPNPDWLPHLLRPLEDPAVGAVGGRIVGTDTTSLELFSALYTLQSTDVLQRHRSWSPWSGGFPTANFAIRRIAIDALKGFDENISHYGEDHDLCARLYESGLALVYTPDAAVTHHHRSTIRAVIRQAFEFGRSHALLLRRHATRGLWLDIPWRPVAIAGWPIPMWVDLAGADKKMLAIVLGGVMYRPVWLLLPMYFAWLMLISARRLKSRGRTASPGGSAILAALLLIKSAAMSVGRWWGSVLYGAICL